MMKRRFVRSIPLLAVLPLLIASIGCDDPMAGLFDPQIAEDTVEFWVPDPQRDDVPTALDVSVSGFGIGGARFPETTTGANEWDLAVRDRDGVLSLLTPQAIGIESRAALAEPVTDRSIEEVERAPVGEFERERVLPLQMGTVYLVRTRVLQGCREQYSKITPTEIDTEEGRVRMHVVTNARCQDDRLVWD